MIAATRLLIVGFLCLPPGAQLHAQTAPPKVMKLLLGRGELIQFEHDVNRVVISEPKIADAVVVGPHEIMVNAKGLGKATLIVWEAS